MFSCIKINDMIIGKIIGTLNKDLYSPILNKLNMVSSQNISKLIIDIQEVDSIDTAGMNLLSCLTERFPNLEIIGNMECLSC